MAKTKVLYVLHNHPLIFPGGAEMYALELFEALRDSDEIEPLLVARADLQSAKESGLYTGDTFKRVKGDPRQYFMFTDFEEFDPVMGTSETKSLYTLEFAEFLRAHQPDVVHFQHTHIIGYDIVTVTRQVLPEAPIVYTLHEYLPICLREGQMIRTERKENELCTHASPRRCNECYPEYRRSASSCGRSSSSPTSRTWTCSSRRAISSASATSTGGSRLTGSGSRSWGGRPRSAGPTRGGATAQPARLLRTAHALQGS